MTEARRGAVLTYTTAGGATEQLWNARDGLVPDYITTTDGLPAWHSGPDSDNPFPPEGMRQVIDWAPAAEPPGRRGRVGWPGTPAVVDGGHGLAVKHDG